MPLHFISRTRDDPPSRIVASPLAEALHSWRLRLRRPCTLMGEGRPPCRPHIRRPGEGRPPRRPHFHVASGFIPRLCPWLRSVLAIRPGVKPVATSASGGTTSASSALQPLTSVASAHRVVRTPWRPHTVASAQPPRRPQPHHVRTLATTRSAVAFSDNL